MSQSRHSHLPRLDSGWYRGHAAVLWTHTTANRTRGWLDADFHRWFREVLLHAGARHAVVCPAYVLMPDHWHIMWIGCAAGSDQHQATRFLRRHAVTRLHGCRLQEQAHDRVLRQPARERGAFAQACHYVRENPVRAGLCPVWQAWPFGGAVVAGYPQLDPAGGDFWDRFWRIYASETARRDVPAPACHQAGHEEPAAAGPSSPG